MFNSVVSYLWGDYEGGSTEAAVAGQKPAEVELPLDVRQEEDWLVVEEGARSPVREEVPSSRLRRPEDDTEGPAPPTVDARRRQVQQQNNAHAAAVLSSENIVTRLRSAQKAQKKKSSKSLSKHKLERENKVYDKSWANKNSNGKQNRPSGCKSGRMCQRV